MSSNLRGLLVQFLPDPLYEDVKHWGGQKDVAVGITRRGQGIKVHPEAQYKPKNHGKWWKVRVTAADKGESLVIQLRDRQQPEPTRMTFTAFIALNTDVEYERSTGRRGFASIAVPSVPAWCMMLTLYCEATCAWSRRRTGCPTWCFACAS